MTEFDFEAIYARYHQRLYRFSLSIVGNPEDARDALQNTMVKALRSLPGEQRQIELKPWLYRVAHNESIELLRKRREQVELDPEIVAGDSGLTETAAQRERLRRLLSDLDSLPERQRAALVMRELGGLEFAEIAEAFDTSDAVARQTVYEARLSLRQLEAGREMTCERVQRQLSDQDGRVTRRRDIQAHLRECAECRAFAAAIGERRRDLASLAPLPAVASAGVLHAVLGGKGAASAGGLGGAIGAGAGKVAGGSALVKSVATVAIVAAVAVPVADRGGLIEIGSGGNGSQAPSRTSVEGAADRAAGGDAATGDAGAVRRSDGAAGTPAGTGADSAAEQKPPSAANPATPPPATGASSTAHPTHELPAASGHGQETAASHGGGRESAGSRGQGEAHSHTRGKPTQRKPPHSDPPAHADPPERPPPSHPPPVQPQDVAPDKGGKPPLQPSQPPADQGAPGEPGA